MKKSFFPTGGIQTPRTTDHLPGIFLGRWLIFLGAFALAPIFTGLAHNLTGDPAHPHYDWTIRPPDRIAAIWLLAQADNGAGRMRVISRPANTSQPIQALPFELFAPRVQVRWDDRFMYIEDNGLPAHPMMAGITAWQQQVPLPQAYFGDNAWRIPLTPTPARQPQMVKGHFLRGAIAIAANGIPIFNPQNNRGEISAEIGELDQWGGHCGRADDYHYHIAPLHLQKVVGQKLPIAYALDGYPIYGLTEPDGMLPVDLDACNGHQTATLGYHYHAAKKYPYLNGGFYGEVVERDGQVDPQPRARPIRAVQAPLRGASIMGLTVSPDEQNYGLKYQVGGASAAVNYARIGSEFWKFEYVSPDGKKRQATYRAAVSNGDLPPEPRPAPFIYHEGRLTETENLGVSEPGYVTKSSGKFKLRSSAVASQGFLPIEYTGDGAGISPPLEWSGAPAGTKSFALIMHHIPGPGTTKWYWVLYNIPAEVQSLPKNVSGIGTVGNNSVNDQTGYAPPHSKGPGPKTYILTIYALVLNCIN